MQFSGSGPSTCPHPTWQKPKEKSAYFEWLDQNPKGKVSIQLPRSLKLSILETSRRYPRLTQFSKFGLCRRHQKAT